VHGLAPLVTKRKAPSVVDAAYSPLLLTTGDMTPVFTSPVTGKVVLDQHATLESQALQPLLHPIEMGNDGRTWADVVGELAAARPLALATDLGAELAAFVGRRTYPALFKQAFGTAEISPERIAMAIASYERTLVSGEAPIDRFLAGDGGALTAEELHGWQVFNAPSTSCATCHPLPRFTDDQFHYLGVRPIIESRGRFYVTLDPDDLGKFRTPSLRNVELRAPFFHQGGTGSLAEVVEFFDRGGDFHGATKSPLMQPLALSPADKAALTAFLGRPLTDPRLAAGVAPFDRPRLASENGRTPDLIGTPSAGSGGFAPRMIALEAPLVGGDHLTLAVDRGLGGASAILLLGTRPSGGVPFLGATSWLAHPTSSILIPAGTLLGSGPGAGWTSHVLALPADPTLLGTRLYAQWFVLDAGPWGSASASEAVRLDLF
jgi:cytochrome c peroxidase